MSLGVGCGVLLFPVFASENFACFQFSVSAPELVEKQMCKTRFGSRNPRVEL